MYIYNAQEIVFVLYTLQNKLYIVNIGRNR